MQVDIDVDVDVDADADVDVDVDADFGVGMFVNLYQQPNSKSKISHLRLGLGDAGNRHDLGAQSMSIWSFVIADCYPV